MTGGRRAACHDDTNLQSSYFINTRTCNTLKVPKTCVHIESFNSFFFYNVGFYEETRNYILIYIYIYIIKGEYLVKNTTDIRIDVIFYD